MNQSPGLKMLVVCQDEEYLKSIEYRLAQALADKADISYISDYECLKEYNAQPKEIDILLIEEKLYQEVIKRQNCRNVYLLVEDEKKADRQEKAGNKNMIYKYSSIRVIIDKIDSTLLQNKQNDAHMNTKLISVYSPAGGCGKTTVALGLANQLGRKGYKVLYLSTEALQDYQLMLGEKVHMPEQAGYQCSMQTEKAAEELLKNVKKSEFEYFPAWKRMLPAYGITTEHLLKIAACIQKKNLYDYMIVELSCEIQETKLNFLYQSDRVVLVTKQDRKTVEKLKQFMTDVVEWKGLGILVCNFYDPLQANCLTEERGKLRYTVCEYIEKLDTAPELQILTNMHILEKTAMAVS